MSSLYYVVGPSGAGKDSLLAYCRSNLPVGTRLAFAHRYITRPVSAGGENHVALSEAEFSTRLAHGAFCLNWDSHGLRYGIGVEVQTWLAAGLSVVVNGSRGHLDQAAAAFPTLVPVLITVQPHVLRGRLESRGRESAADIEQRLARAAAFTLAHPRLITLDNSGPLEQAGAALLATLTTPAEPDKDRTE